MSCSWASALGTANVFNVAVRTVLAGLFVAASLANTGNRAVSAHESTTEAENIERMVSALGQTCEDLGRQYKVLSDAVRLSGAQTELDRKRQESLGLMTASCLLQWNEATQMLGAEDRDRSVVLDFSSPGRECPGTVVYNLEDRSTEFYPGDSYQMTQEGTQRR